ncbi:MAG: type IV secretion system protein [Lautropia sp.]
MQFLRSLIAFLVIGLAALSPQKAHAGIPVLDTANLLQAIEQVIAWGKQYAQMAEQIQQQYEHYAAITGNRGFGAVDFNALLMEVIPNGLVDIYEAVSNGELTAAAQAIRNAQRIYNCQGLLTGEDTARCNSVLNRVSESQAQIRTVYNRLVQRTNQVEALRGRILTTKDPKDIAELNARMVAELTQVSNDNSRIQMMVWTDKVQRQREEQSFRERQLENLQSGDDGLNGLGAAVVENWQNGQ